MLRFVWTMPLLLSLAACGSADPVGGGSMELVDRADLDRILQKLVALFRRDSKNPGITSQITFCQSDIGQGEQGINCHGLFEQIGSLRHIRYIVFKQKFLPFHIRLEGFEILCGDLGNIGALLICEHDA